MSIDEEGQGTRLIAPDIVQPVQFSGMWRGPLQRSGERRLALAVLVQAAEDVRKNRHLRRPSRRRLYQEACEWFRSDDRSVPHAFVSICELLGLPEAELRAAILGRELRRVSQVRRAA
jgi:hypothetical protein